MPRQPGQPRPERLYAWVRTHPQATDAGLAGLAFAVVVLVPGLISGRPADVILGALLIGPLAWRRSDPVASAAVVTVVAFAQLGLYGSAVPADGAVLVTLYALAAYGPRWASRWAPVLAIAGITLAGLRYNGVARGELPFLAAFVALATVTAWLLGTLRRLGRQEQERLAERARLLEVERDQEARLAAAAERARIAREMHDVVAHSLSVTISQADGGRYAAAQDPQAAVDALATIATTGRQALADMRVLLGVLRTDETAERAPQPDAAAIPDLVEQVAAGGLDVRMTVTGRARSLPPGPSLAAYRVVQEALTNVLKHAGPGAVAGVRLSWEPTHLTVTIEDDGRGASAPTDPDGGGNGLIGMTERATLYGGSVRAGPRPGGGFAVTAELPYGARP